LDQRRILCNAKNGPIVVALARGAHVLFRPIPHHANGSLLYATSITDSGRLRLKPREGLAGGQEGFEQLD
jgi:hypothetical protein